MYALIRPFLPHLIGGAVALTALGGGFLYIRHLQGEVREARAAREAAEAQAKVDQATTKALDRYHTQTVILREKADAGVQSVRQAPGADQPVPPDVLSAWKRSLGELRDDAEGADDHRSR